MKEFTLYGDLSDYKKIEVKYFSTKAEAEAQNYKLKTWKHKKIVRARDKSGKLTHGWALVLCK